jgi:hypothetical protein
MKVRRIVTGYNAAGEAVVKTDEQLTAVPRIGAGIKGCEIWSTDEMPVDNSAAADAAQRAGLVKHNNFVGNGDGTPFASTSGRPVTRHSRIALKPWTTQSFCQVRSTVSSIVAKSCI